METSLFDGYIGTTVVDWLSMVPSRYVIPSHEHFCSPAWHMLGVVVCPCAPTWSACTDTTRYGHRV